MTIEKKFLSKSEIKLYYTRDLQKKWFIFWYESKKRIRKYGQVNRINDYDLRLKALEELRNKYLTVSLKSDEFSTPVEEYLSCKDFIDSFTSKKHLWKESTRKLYRVIVYQFTSWHQGKNITNSSIKEYFSALLVTHHKTSHNIYFRVIKSLLKNIEKEHLIKGVSAVRSTKTPAMYLQPHQKRILKEYISNNDPQLWLFINFMYYCFLRPKEAVLLKVQDILFDDGKVFVSKSIAKTDRDRFPRIPKAFTSILSQFKNKPIEDFIFKSNRAYDGHVSKYTFTRRHREILKKLGFNVGTYSLYSWRHTAAINFIQAGGTAEHLQIQMGHATIAQTGQYLRQMGVNDLDKLVEIFPEI